MDVLCSSQDWMSYKRTRRIQHKSTWAVICLYFLSRGFKIAPQDTYNLEDSHTEEPRVKTLPNYHVFKVKTSVIHLHMFQNGHIVKNLATPGLLSSSVHT